MIIKNVRRLRFDTIKDAQFIHLSVVFFHTICIIIFLHEVFYLTRSINEQKKIKN